MHLSRVEITDKRMMTDFYALHSFVYSLFPEAGKYLPRSSADSAGILFRFERGRAPYVLIQSKYAPFWGDTKPFQPTFAVGACFWFRLRANVTFRRATDSRRLGINDLDDQMGWLARKAFASGFALRQASITERPGVVFSARQGKLVAISPVTFEGEIQVTDPELFQRTLVTGIGSGKGFGCGLLSLAAA